MECKRRPHDSFLHLHLSKDSSLAVFSHDSENVFGANVLQDISSSLEEPGEALLSKLYSKGISVHHLKLALCISVVK